MKQYLLVSSLCFFVLHGAESDKAKAPVGDIHASCENSYFADIPREVTEPIFFNCITQVGCLKEGIKNLQAISLVCELWNDHAHGELFLINCSKALGAKITNNEREKLTGRMNGPLQWTVMHGPVQKRREHLLSVLALLSKDPNCFTYKSIYQGNLLFTFGKLGWLKVMARCLDKYDFAVNSPSSGKESLLDWAVRNNRTPLVAFLVENGVMVDKKLIKRAQDYGNEQMIKALTYDPGARKIRKVEHDYGL